MFFEIYEMFQFAAFVSTEFPTVLIGQQNPFAIPCLPKSSVMLKN